LDGLSDDTKKYRIDSGGGNIGLKFAILAHLTVIVVSLFKYPVE
jgi:hypothetical protein